MPDIEKDFYTLERHKQFKIAATITFRYPTPDTFEQADYDWYITVALEKADRVKVNRHLLTAELLLNYRWAIREGYQHQLDPNLRSHYDYPRNQNTIKGIQGYIVKIKKLSDEETNYLND